MLKNSFFKGNPQSPISDSVVLINSADAIGPMNTCFCDLICSFQNEILKKCPSIYSDFKKIAGIHTTQNKGDSKAFCTCTLRSLIQETLE